MQKFEKYLKFIFLILLSLTPIFWFIGRRGIIINGVDTNFPLDPAIWVARRFFAWQSIVNLGADFSAGSAGLFFHLIQLIPFKLGIALQGAEIFSLVFWFTLVVFSSWFLARLILPKKSLPQIIFVTLYSLNIYMFNTWENVKVANLALVVAIPLGLSLLILMREKMITRSEATLASIVIGIILSGAGINPAYIICFFSILTIFLISEILIDFRDKKIVLERIKDFLVIGVFITLINMFWILPTLNFIFTSITASNSIGTLGFSNWVDSLSQNTSIVNVLRMQGAWDWYSFDSLTGIPLYIPYAVRYFNNPFFISFSFLIPCIAFLAFIFRRRKVNLWYLSFAITLVIGIFLTAGTHDPTGVFFTFFAKHVPFFSLFRSPWYIFAPLVALPIAGLVGLFFYEIEDLSGIRKIIMAVGVIFTIFSLVYFYPLVLGKIFRPNFQGSFYIKFPDYVFQTHDYLLKTTPRGRILSYPDDNIERFKWGYSGVDSILNLMSDREIVDASLNDTTSILSQIITQIYESLKKGEVDKAQTLAYKLGIGQIFYKKDQVTLASDLPQRVLDNKIAEFGLWSFYNFPSQLTPLPKIYTANCCILSYPYSDSDKNLSLVGNTDILVNPNDSLLKKTFLVAQSGAVIHANNLQMSDYVKTISSFDLKSKFVERDLNKVEYDFQVDSSGLYSPVIEKYGIDFFGVINQNTMNISLDGKTQLWSVQKMDDSYIYFSSINMPSGSHKLVININNKNLIDNTNFTKSGDGTFDLSNGIYTIVNKSEKDIYLNFPITKFDPGSIYLIGVTYKQIYGNNAQVLMEQKSDSTLFRDQTQSMPDYPDWGNFSFYYQPVETVSNLNAQLIAPLTRDVLGTRVMYKDLTAFRVFSNDLFFKKDIQSPFVLPNVHFSEKSPVSYTGEVSGASGAHLIVFNESYSPQWQLNIDGNSKANIYHFTSDSHSNAWYIDSAPANYKFSIYYQPQKLLNIGYVIAGASALLAISIFVIQKRK